MKKIKKWILTFKLGLNQLLIYRANFILQIVGPALLFFLVKYFLWLKIYEGGGRIIQNFNFSQMIQYHLWVLVVSLINQGASSSNLAEDIRLGRISAYLIYPFNFWEFHFAQFLSHLFVQILVGSIVLMGGVLFLQSNFSSLHFSGIMLGTPLTLAGGFVVTLLSAFWWYGCIFIIGILGLWLDETWTLRVMLQIMAQFLSGAFIPLSFFPEFWQKILPWTPFPLLVDLPLRIFRGEKYLDLNSFALLMGHLIIVGLVASLLWKRGLKRYTGAGI